MLNISKGYNEKKKKKKKSDFFFQNLIRSSTYNPLALVLDSLLSRLKCQNLQRGRNSRRKKKTKKKKKKHETF